MYPEDRFRRGSPKTEQALMSQRKFIRVRSASGRRRYLVGNPLWPLQELRDLHSPPFVADPEFTPFDIKALGCVSQIGPASPSDTTQVRPPRHLCLYPSQRKFPIPRLVAGLPWRWVGDVGRPIVPEAEYARLDLSYIGC
jgi:hypothetical protein